MAGAPPFQALTFRANGRASQIISDLHVCAAFDPKTPPSPLPTRVATKALWDTGASKSVISQGVVRDLGIPAAGATNVTHAGGSSVSPTYMVNFYLPNGVGILGILVTEFPGQITFGAIIGMDVITIGDFAITNVSGKTWMSFRTPSMAAIDYVAEHNKAMFAGTSRNAPCPCGSGQKFKHCHGK
jgi:SEC-C motif/Aspartyl protease